MKKSLLVLATLGSLAGGASAQSAITIYGILDAGLVSERGNAAGTVTKLTSGVQSGTRLGFRGTEDLGGGNSARFTLESGFGMDNGFSNQDSRLFGRQAWVGVGGNWGAVALGRQYSPHYLALMENDPFKVGLAGNAQNLIYSPTRIDNALTYKSPQWSGATAELIYGLGEVTGNPSGGKQFGGSVGYNNGPLNVKLGYHSANDPTGNDSDKDTLLIGTWNFGPVTANLGMTQRKGLLSLDERDYLIGFLAPFGPSTIIGSYIRKDDRTAINRDARQWALGYTYNLSERTNLYTSYGRITNNNGASYTVGSAIEKGSGDQAFNIGIRHKF